MSRLQFLGVRAAGATIKDLVGRRRLWSVFVKRSGENGAGSADLSFPALGFAKNMAAMVLFGLMIALAARSQWKVETS